jgi:hypothetical protein
MRPLATGFAATEKASGAVEIPEVIGISLWDLRSLAILHLMGKNLARDLGLGPASPETVPAPVPAWQGPLRSSRSMPGESKHTAHSSSCLQLLAASLPARLKVAVFFLD